MVVGGLIFFVSDLANDSARAMRIVSREGDVGSVDGQQREQRPPSPPQPQQQQQQRLSLSQGIFNGEVGARMLRICMHLLDSALGELWKGCGADAAYASNLDAVRRWSEPLVREEMSCACRRFDKLEHTFRACFLSFCDDFFSGQRDRRRVAVRQPPLTAFVYSFLVHASEHPSVRSGHVFTDATTVTERLACMDCAREAMFGLATRFVRLLPPVAETASGEEEGVEGEGEGMAREGGHDARSPPSPPSPQPSGMAESDEEGAAARLAPSDEEEDEGDEPSVSPWDSISNVDAPPPSDRGASSRRGATDVVLVGMTDEGGGGGGGTRREEEEEGGEEREVVRKQRR